MVTLFAGGDKRSCINLEVNMCGCCAYAAGVEDNSQRSSRS